MKNACGILILTISLIASVAVADIIVTTHVTVKMMGVSFGDIHSTQMIKGMKSRTMTELTEMMKAIQASDGGDRVHYEILSLDDEIKWIVYPEDRTYTKRCMELDEDPIVPLVGDQQSLDSALSADKAALVWTVDSLKHSSDTCLTMPCRIIRSSATGKSPNTTQTISAICEIWIPEDESSLAELIAMNAKMAELLDMSENIMMKMYEAVFSNFGVTLADMALDTVEGTPLKFDVGLYIEMTENDVSADLDPNGIADAMASKKVLEDAMENMDSESDADTLEVDETARDAMADILARLVSGMKENLKPGRMELFGFSTEITDIDTTALPDSLFDIPDGYTER